MRAGSRSEQTTRDAIVEAADRLFYQQGFDHTSFAHIADAVQISRGNFYFHFKTKDQILAAVIEARLAYTQEMLERWEQAATSPADRLRCFIDMLVVNRADIKRYGCPVGTLCTELAKLNHGSRDEANELIALFRTWLRRQFEALGHPHDADALAMHLLGRSQGVSTLSNALNDERFLRAEVQQLHAWLDACLATRPAKRASK